jgi:hypothetical protein
MDQHNRWAIITPICRNVQDVFECYRDVIKWGECDLFRLKASRGTRHISTLSKSRVGDVPARGVEYVQ